MAKLNELQFLEFMSRYDPSVSFDAATSHAMDVDPSRVSLPSAAGILDPADHLTGDRLHEFVSMAKTIPTGKPTLSDAPACHKVSDKGWPILFKKLYQADMITFPKKKDV